MVVVIQRFHCIQLPEIAIIGVGNSPTTYFVHAQQVVGLLLNKASRRAAASDMHAFFKSEEGKRMEHGGDLSDAYSSAAFATETHPTMKFIQLTNRDS